MPFSIQKQEQNLWCWAAVSASVDAYFSPNKFKSQSEIANLVLTRSDCSPANRVCNQRATLQDALAAVTRLQNFETRPLEFHEIREQIDKKLPVCVRIGWFGSGGHFVVISGYAVSKSGRKLLSVRDPFYHDSVLEYEEFASAYLMGRGSWTDSFFIKGP